MTVMSYGGNFCAVMPYVGIFLAVGGLPFFGGNIFGGGGKTKVWRQIWGGNPDGGNLSAVGGFSFFGGNDFGGGGKSKIWQCTAILPLPPSRAITSRRQNYRR